MRRNTFPAAPMNKDTVTPAAAKGDFKTRAIGVTDMLSERSWILLLFTVTPSLKNTKLEAKQWEANFPSTFVSTCYRDTFSQC